MTAINRPSLLKSTPPFGVIILAAGESRRMGQPKMLLPWGNTSILGHHIRTWQKLHPKTMAVVHARHPAIEKELGRLKIPSSTRILNRQPHRGMFSSIQVAARKLSRKRGVPFWVLVLGDQPQIPMAVFQKLLRFTERHPYKICQPTRSGRPRHPVALPLSSLRELAHARENNLKEFLQNRKNQLAFCPMRQPALEIDLDEPIDYQNARKQFLRKA